MELRLYETEEYLMTMHEKRYICRSTSVDNESPEVEQRRQYVKCGVPYSFLRFCDSIKGFHKGSLDLSGRHPERYRSLLQRWSEFSIQLGGYLSDAAHTGRIPVVAFAGRTDSDPSPSEVQCPEANVLKRVKVRWNIDLCETTLQHLFPLSSDVSSYIASGKGPVFQRLSLVQLPPELLHYVAQFSSGARARALGATCKLFRQIVLPYISKRHYIGLNTPFSCFKHIKSGASREEITKQARQVGQNAQTKLNENAKSLRTGLYPATRIQDVYSRGWPIEFIYLADWNHEEFVEFNTTICRGLQSAFEATLNVRRLRLSMLAIDAGLAKAILSMPKLSHLMLEACRSTFDALTLANCPPSNLEHLTIIPVAPTLEIYDQWAPWALLPFLRHARWLNIKHGDLDRPSMLPRVFDMVHFKPFTVLERVSMSGLALSQCEQLIRMLQDAAGLAQKPLTHLRISFDVAMPMDILSAISGALSGFPLQSLVLERTKCVTPAIIERIAMMLPNLRALTFIRMKKKRRYDSDIHRAWPRPSWEYARALRHFHHLEYFSWNVDRVEGVVWSSRCMLYFEEGFGEESMDDDGVDEYEEETVLMGKLFAAYCPTLKRLVFLWCNGMRRTYCDISRPLSGREAVVLLESESDAAEWPWSMCDPGEMPSWPYFDKSLSRLEGYWEL
ncbi:hypothetical protein PHLGIDRAFT_232069 [Phlebiopsis gigantea 11061_1 CR5-6]|uniref:F-box domain-containing protein n=1 Tax=Phlebiopsis gigantea (strain 11061_1 CR5-6) TaxID=745531 RepID=A0A0C3NYG7_PHLG1|nr:hypothetical protein PHLGIDRAFT_232069 [Phlebiopsis gigantea 11061_1 CR5-6]